MPRHDNAVDPAMDESREWPLTVGAGEPGRQCHSGAYLRHETSSLENEHHVVGRPSNNVSVVDMQVYRYILYQEIVCMTEYSEGDSC